MTIEIPFAAGEYSSKILTFRPRGLEDHRYIRPVTTIPLRAGRRCVAAAVIVALALLGPVAGAGASKAAATTTTLTGTAECTASQLSYSRPEAVSAQMGEDGFVITLTNLSAERCQIHGYPTVRFYTSAGRLLTFNDVHTSVYFRHRPPRLVPLVPGGHGYFLVAKYRCDIGNRYWSSFFYVVAPYTTGSPRVVHARGDGLGGGVGVMDYCKGPARGMDHDLGITPIVASRSELFS
jgi:hypothetical protein